MCWRASREGESGVKEEEEEKEEVEVVVVIDWRLNPEECTSVWTEGFEDIDQDRRCVFFRSLLYLFVAGGLDWLLVVLLLLLVSYSWEDEGGFVFNSSGSTQT